MGLLKNLRLLLSDSLISRMSELESRQDLLEEHVQGRLDSMKQYHARVEKRARDAQGAPETNDRRFGNGHVSPAVARLMARRAGRGQLNLG